MTEQELQKLVEKISLTYFDQPFCHRAKINTRMTTTGGRYHLADHHLEINAHFLVSQYQNELLGIIKHELVHYHLHMAGKGYRHCDRDFKILLNKVGGSRYTPDIGLKRKQAVKFNYFCQACGQCYSRVRRINLQRYVCGKCGGKLQLTSLNKY